MGLTLNIIRSLVDQAGAEVMGRVTASPTANTVLARLKDVYDRLSTLPQLPAALVSGRLDENLGAWLGSTDPTVGQKVMASSVPVVFASDQTAMTVTLGVSATATTGIVSGSLQLGGATVGTLNAVRGTSYTEPTTDAQRSLSSASASDASAGVGARTVRVDYMTLAGVKGFEIVTLNGTTAVNTVASFCYIERLTVLTVGSTLRNVGVITLFGATGGGGGTVGTIGVGTLVSSAGDNRTLWSHHYVPAGKTAKLATYIISAESGGSGTNATFFLRSQVLPVSSNADITVSDILLVVGPLVRQLAIPIEVIGPARVTAYGIPGGNNVKLNASFDFSELNT